MEGGQEKWERFVTALNTPPLSLVAPDAEVESRSGLAIVAMTAEQEAASYEAFAGATGG